MKKILHIVESFGGGVFSFLVDLVNGTAEEYEIVIAYGLRDETFDNFQDYFSKKIKFVQVENFTRNINVKKDINAFKEIKKIIKEEKPDVIHLHSSKAGILGRLASNGNKIKMFYNPHGFSFLKKDKFELRKKIYWFIEKITAILNKKCTIIACSKGEYEEARRLNKNCIYINNGIDVKKIDKEIMHLSEKKIDYDNIKICTVGRIEYQKKPTMFNDIAKNFPEIEFTWVGDGTLRNKLMSSNIQVTGWLTSKEVIEILNQNDIFILPSLFEGLPISLLEAMYLKKICIVSNCIGSTDVIRNEKNGFIATSLKENVEIIRKIKNNEIKINEIVQIAQQDVKNKFNSKIMIYEYIKIYEGKNKRQEL